MAMPIDPAINAALSKFIEYIDFVIAVGVVFFFSIFILGVAEAITGSNSKPDRNGRRRDRSIDRWE